MNKDISKNLITNLLAVFVTMLANFIITPIVTQRLGLVAYSYVGIISNLIAFFTVFSYTLNSMVGRFYTICFQKNNLLEANAYIASALYSCLLLSLVFVPIFVAITVYLEKLIVISPQYVHDVKVAFLCSCISFIVSTINSVFSTGAYAKNKLYITNTYTIIAGVIRAYVTYMLFKFLEPHIWFISLTTLLQSISVVILAFLCFKKLIPSVSFSPRLFSKKKSFELLSAGSSNAIIMMGNTLMTQIDLLVGNRLIDAETVGAYSVILTFSTMMRSVGTAVSNSFSPTTLKLYAEDGVSGIREYSNRVVTLIGIILGWPSAIIACLGCAFVNIWLKRDLSHLYYVFVIIMLPMGANLACTQLYVVQQAVNKLKIPAAASILVGIFNIGLAVVFAKVFGLGIFGIALASSISFSLRNMLFQPIYTSFITKQPAFAFFPGLLKPIVISALLFLLWDTIKKYLVVSTILEFLVVAVVLSLVYFAFAYVALNRTEKETISAQIRRRINSNDK